MPRSIFITATDTGAGKTWVTTRLLRSLLDRGESAQALKPVASGVLPSGINEDVQALMDVSRMPVSALNFLTFQTPVAPSLAAHREQVQWQPNQLLGWLQEREKAANLTLIEGVGGLMVPLTGTYLVSDWLRDMADAQVLLVVRARLGGINHALLTLESLDRMGRRPAYVIVNDADGAGEAMLRRHIAAIRARAGDAFLLQLSHSPASGYAEAAWFGRVTQSLKEKAAREISD